MNYRRAIGRPLLLVLLACFCARAAYAASISIAEYRRQLQQLAQRVDDLAMNPDQSAKLVSETPDTLSVATGSGDVNVNFKTLKADLAAFSRVDEEKRAPALARLQNHVHELNLAAEAYEKQSTSASEAHGKLSQILSRREFSKVRGPDPRDAFLARVYRWLSRLLRIRGGSRFDWMKFVIYLLIGTAATLLVIWAIRRPRRPKAELSPREIIPFAPSARSWRTWLAEARVLADQQDWRNAIHLAYWAGISYLEERGAWKPNRARTPREYLRLIGSRAAQYPVLAALTRKLESVWYGYADAGESDFHDALSQLEKLGCR